MNCHYNNRCAIFNDSLQNVDNSSSLVIGKWGFVVLLTSEYLQKFSKYFKMVPCKFFNHTFYNYLGSTCCTAGTILQSGDTEVSKTVFSFINLSYFLQKQTITTQINMKHNIIHRNTKKKYEANKGTGFHLKEQQRQMPCR